MCFFQTYLVWCDAATLPITVGRYGSVYPFPLNHWVTFLKKRSTLSRLDAVGWLKKDIEEARSCFFAGNYAILYRSIAT